MSARINRSLAATVAASALLGSAALAFPAAANAATASASPLRTSLTSTSTAALQPGGAARTEIFKVTNTTGKAQKFWGDLMAFGQGSVYLGPGAVKASATALGRTPATATFFERQTPGFTGLFYPKGSKLGEFTIPAHATFSWKIAIAATKAFTLNDKGIEFNVAAGSAGKVKPSVDSVAIKVGSGRTGGPVVEKLTGDVELTAYNHPAFELLTVTNHTGATLKAWDMLPWVAQKPGAKLAVDVWVGSAAKGHWQPLTRDLSAAGLANGATKSFELRVRVVSYTVKTEIQDQLEITNWSGDVSPSPHIGLLVH